MSSRAAAVVTIATVTGLLAAMGCNDAPSATLVHLDGRALTPMELVPGTESASVVPGGGAFRWYVIDAPAASGAQNPQGDETATFLPDVRGTYVIERWYVYGVGEELTHRFIINVLGAPPIASAVTDSAMVPVSSTVVVDGTSSSSPEGRSLTYHWRLALRPLGSASTAEPDPPRIQFVPDVAGDYVLELSVFDGDLWSDPPAMLALTAL